MQAVSCTFNIYTEEGISADAADLTPAYEKLH